MAVGPSPPRETRPVTSTNESLATDRRDPIRASPYPETKHKVERHSISVGPSPPRENTKQETNPTGQKKFVGTSPPRDVRPESRSSSIAGKTNVSNTGTSPPPQSISTQVISSFHYLSVMFLRLEIKLTLPARVNIDFNRCCLIPTQ